MAELNASSSNTCIDDDWKKFCADDSGMNSSFGDTKNKLKKHNTRSDVSYNNSAIGLKISGNTNENEDEDDNEDEDEDSTIIALAMGEEKIKREISKYSDDASRICTELYISTQTKIAYLNMPIVLNDVFWQIPIILYHLPQEGIVKKQMKFNLNTQEELTEVLNKSKKYLSVSHHIINQIINPTGRIKFKDVRKVSIGICKKDITSSRCKKKSAFYNCFVVILRILHNGLFKEINVKVFNTGKLEIPGIQNKEILEKVLNMLVDILHPIVARSNPEVKINFIDKKSETVLINSNFSCGYFINREKMYDLLKYKYKINSAYDPCSYPGIQCEFYYNNNTSELVHNQKSVLLNKEYTRVSFMIFRTGSVLIVGKCNESILHKIYDFICAILIKEYDNVKEPLSSSSSSSQKDDAKSKTNKTNKKGRKYICKN